MAEQNASGQPESLLYRVTHLASEPQEGEEKKRQRSTKLVGVRFTPDEYKLLSTLAYEEGLNSIAAFVAATVRKNVLYPRMPMRDEG